MALRLMARGDFPEFSRRVRVRLLGNARVPAPTLESAPVRRVGSRKADGPVKALMFAHNLNREGAPISQFEMTKALFQRGALTPDVVAFSDGPLRRAYEDLGIEVTILPSYLDRIATLRRLERVIDELAALVRSRDPEVVYSNTLLMFAPVLAAHKAGVPSVLNPRESEPWETYFGFLSQRVAQEALKSLALPEQVVFVSEASRVVWSRFDVDDRFVVIRNSIPVSGGVLAPPGACRAETRSLGRGALAACPSDVLFLCVGTLCERKGQLDLIEAFSLLPEDAAARMRLCLVGDQDPRYADRLHARIARLPPGRQVRIRVLDATPDIALYYAAADVLVHCARVESYPRVILEAMAHALPILSTPVFGIAEQVSEGQNALFYRPGDCCKLAEWMELLSKDRELRATLAEGSLSRLATLGSFDQMVEAYQAVFFRACRPVS
jgi:glycosyltransferase involved in cell wall biosynthesis